MSTAASAAPGATRTPLWLSIVACSLPMFMTALDNLVVSTALRTLQQDLSASTQDLQWFVNAYTLGFACFLLVCAGLGDRYGRRRFFVAGITVFTLASVGCGLSTGSGQLILFRALQGLGAAAVMPLSLTLLSAAVPDRLRGLAVGLWSAVSGTAVALGPVVGGAVVDGLAWQWIFWINVPVGLVAVPLALVVLKESRGERARIDVEGMLLVTVGLLALVWGIVNGETRGWTDGRVLLALAGGTVLLALFTLWERRTEAPLLPLRFYRIRAFTLTNVVSAAMYFGVFGSIFLLAQYLQIAPPRTPLHAGVLTLSWTLMPMFVAPLAGMLTNRVGGGRLMGLGLLLQAAGLAWINLVATVDTPYSRLVAPMVLAGIGMGLTFAPAATVVLSAVRREEHGKASGANSTAREVGGVLGVAVLGTVFAAYGGYASAQDFVDGVRPALWIGAAVTALGGLVAFAIPRQPVRNPEPESDGADPAAPDVREVEQAA
ncbi:MFS transporter [Streptomyces sp. DH37]|uniref:MFS transporter n=1 Tax=Streptomyces sp. DH37 TaxID=3040122 RepID=UPI0024420B8D|nr:MFS transporter [Streptomyces sp. DH37]MDG9702007.1 MFS transporter [Streptomyces sp. DH37]